MNKLAVKKRLDNIFERNTVGWIFDRLNYTRLARRSIRYKDFLTIGIRRNVLVDFVNNIPFSKMDH